MKGRPTHSSLILSMVVTLAFLSYVSSFGATIKYDYNDAERKITITHEASGGGGGDGTYRISGTISGLGGSTATADCRFKGEGEIRAGF